MIGLGGEHYSSEERRPGGVGCAHTSVVKRLGSIKKLEIFSVLASLSHYVLEAL